MEFQNFGDFEKKIISKNRLKMFVHIYGGIEKSICAPQLFKFCVTEAVGRTVCQPGMTKSCLFLDQDDLF